MSLDADLIVDRRRMRRKLTFWRVLAVLFIAVVIVGAATFLGRRSGFAGAGNYIARVTIQGLIRDDAERVQQLERLGQSTAARAVSSGLFRLIVSTSSYTASKRSSGMAMRGV